MPGIEPYREYLYLYLRDQPIWHSLRFWNAAFFDALQCERANKPVPRTRSFIKVSTRVGQKKRDSITKGSELVHSNAKRGDDREDDNDDGIVDEEEEGEGDQEPDDDEDDLEGASVSVVEDVSVEELERKQLEIDDDQRFQQNITFGQLGTFTCNMHAFGLSKPLCLEFLRKQCTIANLSGEHEKLLRDNIIRMYRETDKWRT